MDSRTIIAYGEILWDRLPTGDFLGGAPFNFACRSAMLGNRAYIVSRVGDDDFGDRAVESAATLGVDVTNIQRDPVHPTGTVRITFDHAKTADITIMPNVAYDYIDAGEALLDLAGGADCLCFGTVAQRSAQSRATLHQLLDRAPGAVKLYDINLRKECYTPDVIAESLERADVVKLNAEEALEISRMLGNGIAEIPAIASWLAERWELDCCVVTLAERGVFAVSKVLGVVYVPGYAVDLVDPLGAGDAFTAGFIHHYLREAPLAECCAFGNILGALTAGADGATGIIDKNAIDSLARDTKRLTVDPSLKQYMNEGN